MLFRIIAEPCEPPGGLTTALYDTLAILNASGVPTACWQLHHSFTHLQEAHPNHTILLQCHTGKAWQTVDWLAPSALEA